MAYLARVSDTGLRELYDAIGRSGHDEVQANLNDFTSWATAIEDEFDRRQMNYDAIAVDAL